ncbi:hypothetical protein QVD17_38205 [Tagetes erecta]|uniref:Uncharacterized protein n=1 Tax=Tagetes erecta TaxID=13708 RepID=A0AAD8NKQ0_TARER|nr:hypothetical protein QVD17_38205 [Tagetes erecta]
MMLSNVSPQNAALITSVANSPGAVSEGSSSYGSVKSGGGSTSVGAGSNAFVTTQIPSDTTALSRMLVHNHETLIVEVVEESVLNDNYIDCFDPFKEFYGEEVENVKVIDEVEEGMNTGKVAEVSLIEEVAEDGLMEERKDAGKVAEMVIDIGKDQEEAAHSGFVCEAVVEKEEKLKNW